MLLTINNLQKGIQKFQSHKNWSADFHNSLYASLIENRKDNFEKDIFWSYLIDILTKWKALRPLTKSEVFEKIKSMQPDITAAVNAMTIHGDNLQIVFVEWDQAEVLFRVLSKIKNNNSPVFPSKICHFLFPTIYPVADRELIQIHKTTYEWYWKQCKQNWIECSEKDLLKKELQSNINGNVIPEYPWATRIFELCYTGAIT